MSKYGILILNGNSPYESKKIFFSKTKIKTKIETLRFKWAKKSNCWELKLLILRLTIKQTIYYCKIKTKLLLEILFIYLKNWWQEKKKRKSEDVKRTVFDQK